MRLIYLLFPMGWAVLGFSIWNGMRVRGTYIAYLLGQPKDVTQRTDRIEQLNGFALSQEEWLYFGLAIFAVWLLIYLIWWLFWSNGKRKAEKTNGGKC